jgi:hypothetical protein
MEAAYILTWANLPVIAVVALLVPVYMFSGDSTFGHSTTCTNLVVVL